MSVASKAVKSIPIASIRRDGGTQSRDRIDPEVVAEYAAKMGEAATFPPVTVFFDWTHYWLADGFHRVGAAEDASLKSIECDVRQGTRRDAILHSVGANDAHGLRRSNADKRRAVQTLLADEEWSRTSSRWIAKQCCVHHELVERVRAEATGGSASSKKGARDGRDGKSRKAPKRSVTAEPTTAIDRIKSRFEACTTARALEAAYGLIQSAADDGELALPDMDALVAVYSERKAQLGAAANRESRPSTAEPCSPTTDDATEDDGEPLVEPEWLLPFRGWSEDEAVVFINVVCSQLSDITPREKRQSIALALRLWTRHFELSEVA